MKTYPKARHNDSFSITYRPYFLNHHSHPLIPYMTGSVPKDDLAEKKLAHLSPEQRDALRKKMDRIGQAVGVHFRYGGLVGPTRDAHRLVYASRKMGARQETLEDDDDDSERSKFRTVQDRLVEGLLSAYHEQERDIADRQTLRDIALVAGMTDQEIDEALSSEDVARAVDEEQEEYRLVAEGKGVPVYVIQGQHRIEGAQDPSDFFDVFIKVKEAEEANSTA